MADDINWSDPCAAAAALRKAYMDTMTAGGGQITRIRFGDREVAYSADAGNLTQLREEMQRQEALCAIAQGTQPKRRAIRAGSYRPPMGGYRR